jgi:hypothetical protein
VSQVSDTGLFLIDQDGKHDAHFQYSDRLFDCGRPRPSQCRMDAAAKARAGSKITSTANRCGRADGGQRSRSRAEPRDCALVGKTSTLGLAAGVRWSAARRFDLSQNVHRRTRVGFRQTPGDLRSGAGR